MRFARVKALIVNDWEGFSLVLNHRAGGFGPHGYNEVYPMAVRKTKPAKRVGKKPARAGKPAAKRATVAKKAPAKKAAAKKVVKPAVVKQAVARPAAKTPAAPPAAVAKRKETSKIAPLDVSAFPQESIAIFER